MTSVSEPPLATAEPRPEPERQKPENKLKSRALAIFEQFWFVVVFLIGWDLVARFGPFPNFMVPTPFEVVTRGIHVIANGTLLENLWASVQRQFIGFGLGVIVGFLLGLGLGISKRARTWFIGPLRLLYPIPGLAWIPLAILWFGIGNGSMIFVIFMSSIWPVMFNTIAGVDSISQTHLRAGRALAAGPWTMLSRLYIPGALAFSLTGIRLSFGTAWRVIVGAEMIAASVGLGYMINNARSILRGDELIVGMIAIAVIGYLIERFAFDGIQKVTLERWGLRAAV